MNRHHDQTVKADLHLLWLFWTGLCWDVCYFSLIQVNRRRHMKGRSAKPQFNWIIWTVNHFHMGCMHAFDRPAIRFNILWPVCVHCELLVWPLAWGYYPCHADLLDSSPNVSGQRWGQALLPLAPPSLQIALFWSMASTHAELGRGSVNLKSMPAH